MRPWLVPSERKWRNWQRQVLSRPLKARQHCSQTWSQRWDLRTPPSSVLLRTQQEIAMKERDGAKPQLDKTEAAEKRLRARQKAVEAATT